MLRPRRPSLLKNNIEAVCDYLRGELQRKQCMPFSKDTCLEILEELPRIEAFAKTSAGAAFNDVPMTGKGGMFFVLQQLRGAMQREETK